MERWAWAGAGAVAAVMLLALVVVPFVYKATLPTTGSFIVLNDSSSQVVLAACADRCQEVMILDPGQSWDVSSAPVRAILVERPGSPGAKCLLPPRGVSRPVFLVTRAGSCPPWGVPA